MVEFTRKVVIVTDASSGLGRTSAVFFAREGISFLLLWT